MNNLIQLGRETFEFGSRGLKRLNRKLRASEKKPPISSTLRSLDSSLRRARLGRGREVSSYTEIGQRLKSIKRGSADGKSIGRLESPAEIKAKIFRKRMDGMQRHVIRTPWLR